MADDFQPSVASVIPVLNEAQSIIQCLESLCSQSYPDNLHQIHIFDGGSTDSTWQLISDFIATRGGEQPLIHLHKNPEKYVAQARNLALKIIPKSVEYMFEIIGHCTVGKEHIQTMVNVMGKLQKANNNSVGALGCKVSSKTGKLGLVESWIEAGLSSPLASGNGQFDNFSGTEQTNVPAFCLHYRKALNDVNGWDNSFITSQDSDLSMRLKSAGYQLYRTDSAIINMSKRSTLRSWSKMGFRYGFWRTKLLQRHKGRASLREFLPWFGLLLTISLAIMAVEIWFLPPLLYLILILIEGLRFSIVKQKISLLIGTPVAILILHTTFSFGLFYGLFGRTRSFNDRESNDGNLN